MGWLHNYSTILLIFFFSSRRRHTRYWRDWSSDVCSSDLNGCVTSCRSSQRCQARTVAASQPTGCQRRTRVWSVNQASGSSSAPTIAPSRDRESVVVGKRVDLGGRRIIKKKKILKQKRTAV